MKYEEVTRKAEEYKKYKLFLCDLKNVSRLYKNTYTDEKIYIYIYEGWNFNFGNTPLDWIQELME